jgi:hypothetical protein
VEARLAKLKELAVIERDDEARARLARERPETNEPFPLAVQRRLHELRALCELASYLHRAGARGAPTTSD